MLKVSVFAVLFKSVFSYSEKCSRLTQMNNLHSLLNQSVTHISFLYVKSVLLLTFIIV